jgi:hypothetical protein
VLSGADKEARDEEGQTPLHIAVWSEKPDCVEGLARAGADKEVKNADGETPLHVAARHGKLECLNALVRAGADKEARSRKGETPLRLAAWHGNTECVEALVRVGADKEARDEEGKTALHWAVYCSAAVVIESLVALGADSTAKTAGGQTPAEVAHTDEARAALAAALARRGGGCDLYAMDACARAAYRQCFRRADADGDGFVGREDAKAFFEQEALGRAGMRVVWAVADAEKDNRLSEHEFAVALHLARLEKKGVPLPLALSASLAQRPPGSE